MSNVIDGATSEPIVMRRRPTGGPAPLPHSMNRATLAGLAVSAIAVVLIVFSTNTALRDHVWEPELRLMRTIAEHRAGWLTSVLDPFYDLAYSWAVPVLLWLPVAMLIATRRFRSAMTYFGGFLLVVLTVSLLDDLILRPRPVDIEILGRWEGFAHPEPKVAAITAVVTSFALHSIPHGRVRRDVKIAAALLVALLAVAAMYLGVSAPTAVGSSIAIGFAIPQLMFRWVTPPEVFPVQLRPGNTAHLEMTPTRVAAIRVGVATQLGITVDSAHPIALDGSAGSTPLLLSTTDGAGNETRLFAKLYAQSHLRSDRLYKIGRTLLYGRLEDEATFTSVRRLVEYEDYLATKMSLAGIRTARSLGVVELTPDREYVAVFEFLTDATELGDHLTDEDMSVQLVDDGIEIVEALWQAGLAHRDIKPSNLMVTADCRLAVIDVAFGQVRPTSWRQLVDLGNMLQLLALGADPALVVDRARQRFTDDEIADSLAAAHGVAVPTQLRNALKADQREVRRQLVELVPRRDRIAIQRWSVTRLALAGGVVAFVFVALTLVATSAQLAGLLP